MANAIVWGAGGGIGGALVEALVGRGWTVVGVARSAADLAAVAARGAHAVEADVADVFAVQRAVHEATMALDGPLELCAYAAGDIVAEKVGELDPAAWRRVLAANLDGAFHVARHTLPQVAEDGHLVLVGAVSERLRLPRLAAYAAAKAGLEAFADVLRKEERRRRITVVRPGAVDTAFWDKVPLRKPADAPSPAKVAARILEAHDAGEDGTLDLV